MTVWTFVFYVAVAMCAAAVLSIAAIWLYGLGKRRARNEMDAEPGDYSALMAAHQVLLGEYDKVTEENGAFREELAEFDAAIETLRRSQGKTIGELRAKVGALEQRLHAADVLGEDLTHRNRLWTKHLEVCPTAQAVEYEDIAKRVSDR